MRVVYKVPNHAPFECEIPNSLNALQSMVQGHIEVLELKNGVDMIVNEMGKLENTPLNNVLWLQDIKQEVAIYGAMVLCSTDDEDFCSLDNKQLVYALDVAESGVV